MTSAGRISVQDAAVPMRDGVPLAADVTVPDDGEQHPVLLVRTPYSRQGLREAHDPIGYARKGWAVVLQDVRGRFDSGGEFRPLHQEIADGKDTVDWCAAQPWSNGTVAMTGASYNGATQWLAAHGAPKGLGAIAPVVSSTDYRDDWTYEGGVMHSSFLATWALMLASTKPGVELAQVEEILALANDWPSFFEDPDLVGLVARFLPDYGRWADPADRDYWKPLRVHAATKRLDLPVWQAAGWFDLFCEGTIRSHVAMTRTAASDYARRSQRLVIGPWTHAALYQQVAGDVDFGTAANGIGRGLPAELHDFLSAALRKEEVPAGVTLFVMGSNVWRDYESWPPPAQETELFLDAVTGARSVRGDGSLSWTAPPPSSVGWRHDPRDPVPTLGGRTLIPVLPPSGSVNQRRAEEREDVLVFTSEPMRADLTVIGTITAMLRIQSSAAQTDVFVKLCDVSAEGLSVNVVDSVQRVELTPGRAKTVDVRVGSTAMTFLRGHRLRVEIASSSFPRFTPLGASDQTLFLGGTTPARLVLPVVRD